MSLVPAKLWAYPISNKTWRRLTVVWVQKSISPRLRQSGLDLGQLPRAMEDALASVGTLCVNSEITLLTAWSYLVQPTAEYPFCCQWLPYGSCNTYSSSTQSSMLQELQSQSWLTLWCFNLKIKGFHWKAESGGLDRIDQNPKAFSLWFCSILQSSKWRYPISHIILGYDFLKRKKKPPGHIIYSA